MSPRTILVAIVLALAAAAPARAATLVVDQAAGPYSTIHDALRDAEDGDTVEVHAGTYVESTGITQYDLTLRGGPGVTLVAPDGLSRALVVGGARSTVDHLTIVGGVQLTGGRVRLINSTVTAPDDALDLWGPFSMGVDHTLIHATAPAGTAIRAHSASIQDAPQTVDLATSIVVGGPQGTALDVITGKDGLPDYDAGTTVTIRSSTVAGAATALKTTRAGAGGPVVVNAFNSIVHGAAPGLTGWRVERDATDAATFVDAGALDFRPRADAPAVGFSDPAPRPDDLPDFGFQDFGGGTRAPLPPGAVPIATVGAFSFVDSPPAASFTASTDSTVPGAPVTFDASASSDPDPGGRVASYIWSFGDERSRTITTTATAPAIQHAYARPGNYTVFMTAVDNNGVKAWAGLWRLTVRDVLAPTVAITTPKALATVRRHLYAGEVIRDRTGRRHRVPTRVRLAGRVRDDVWVGRVELVLQQTSPRPRAGWCRYLDAARRRVVTQRCSAPAPIATANIHGRTWSWQIPMNFTLPAGRWELRARAVDVSGNAAAARPRHFTVR